MMCSRSQRLMDAPAMVGIQKWRKRRRLPDTAPFFGQCRHSREQLRQRAPEQGLPLDNPRLWMRSLTRFPVLQNGRCLFHQGGVSSYLFGKYGMDCQTPCVGQSMTGIDQRRRRQLGLPTAYLFQPQCLPAGPQFPHSFGGGLRVSGGWAAALSRRICRLLHPFIVIRYD